MPFYYMVAFATALSLTIACCVIAHRSAKTDSSPVALILCLAGVALVLGLFLFQSLALLVDAMILGAITVVWRILRVSPRYFIAMAIVALLGTYGTIAVSSMADFRRFQESYPFVSLEDRLPALPESHEAPPLTKVSTQQLDELESYLDHLSKRGVAERRHAVLRNLHERMVHAFLSQPGFGMDRMTGLNEGALSGYFEPDRMIMQPTIPKIAAPFDESPSQPGLISDVIWDSSQFRISHRDVQTDLFDPAKFGYVRDRSHVAGFIPHRMTRFPQSGERWRTVELVGLVVHPKPTVYVSNFCPAWISSRGWNNASSINLK